MLKITKFFIFKRYIPVYSFQVLRCGITKAFRIKRPEFELNSYPTSRQRAQLHADPPPPRPCGTKRRRDEEHLRTTQTPHRKSQAHQQRRTATEEPPWNDQKENYWGA